MLIGDNLTLKICDFGWCVADSEPRETFCGTLEYMPPEMIENGQHNHTLDVWGLGILLYELLHGHAPYQATEYVSMKRLLEHGKIKYRKGLPDDVKDLIYAML